MHELLGKKDDRDGKNILLVLNSYIMSSIPVDEKIVNMVSTNLEKKKSLACMGYLASRMKKFYEKLQKAQAEINSFSSSEVKLMAADGSSTS